MSSFIIQPASKEATLDSKSRTGSVRIGVTNSTKKQIRGTPKVVSIDSQGRSLDSPAKDWLSLAGGNASRSFEPEEKAKSFDVEVKVPAGGAAGDYYFRLNISNEADPNGDFEVGPAVKFIVPGKTDPPPPPSRWWIWVVIGAVVVVGAVVIYLLIPKGVEVPLVEVPPVKGKTFVEASNLLVKAEFGVTVSQSLATGTNAIGIVIDSTPKAGEKLAKNAVVDLAVEKELDKVTVPDLKGIHPDQLTKLENFVKSGLKWVLEKKQATGTEKPGFITSQKPPAGSSVAPGATVTYVVEEVAQDPAPPYVGTWDNQNVTTPIIKTFTITWREKKVFVRVWSRDSNTDWGEKQARVVNPSQLETIWDRGLNNVTLLMTIGNQAIGVAETSKPKAVGLSNFTRVESFVPRQIHFQKFRTVEVMNPTIMSPKAILAPR